MYLRVWLTSIIALGVGLVTNRQMHKVRAFVHLIDHCALLIIFAFWNHHFSLCSAKTRKTLLPCLHKNCLASQTLHLLLTSCYLSRYRVLSFLLYTVITGTFPFYNSSQSDVQGKFSSGSRFLLNSPSVFKCLNIFFSQTYSCTNMPLTIIKAMKMLGLILAQVLCLVSCAYIMERMNVSLIDSVTLDCGHHRCKSPLHQASLCVQDPKCLASWAPRGGGEDCLMCKCPAQLPGDITAVPTEDFYSLQEGEMMPGNCQWHCHKPICRCCELFDVVWIHHGF